MKFILALLCAVTLSACSSTTSQYYEAVEKAAQANADFVARELSSKFCRASEV